MILHSNTFALIPVTRTYQGARVVVFEAIVSGSYETLPGGNPSNPCHAAWLTRDKARAYLARKYPGCVETVRGGAVSK